MDCEKTFYALGTQNALFCRGADAEKAFGRGDDRVTEIDERMSAFRPESEVSAIAREAGEKAVPVDKDVYFVLKKSLYYAKASGGAFDCTLRPLTALWNFFPFGNHSGKGENRLFAGSLSCRQSESYSFSLEADGLFKGSGRFRRSGRYRQGYR